MDKFLGSLLGPSDVQILREVIHQEKMRRRGGAVGQFYPTKTYTPEVYIAKTPAQGIRPRGFPSGEVSESVATIIGEVCQFYRRDGVDVVSMDRTEVVYNLSDSKIEGNKLLLAVRDKDGTWVAALDCCGPPLAGSGSDEISLCPRCDWPAYFCVTVEFPDGAPSGYPDSFGILIPGGAALNYGRCASYFSQTRVFAEGGGYLLSSTIFLDFGYTVETGRTWNFYFGSGGCNVACTFSASGGGSGWDCASVAAFDELFSGIIGNTDCDNPLLLPPYEFQCDGRGGTGKPFTVRVTPSGGAGSDCDTSWVDGGGGGGSGGCCDGVTLPEFPNGTLLETASSCSGLDGAALSFTKHPSLQQWTSNTLALPDGSTVVVQFFCSGGTVWTLGLISGGAGTAYFASTGGTFSSVGVTVNCSPLFTITSTSGDIRHTGCPGAALTLSVSG